MPLPDRDFDVTEVAVPWKLLSEAGHRVVFATEHGAAARCDPLLLTGVVFGQLGAKAEPAQFYAELVKSGELDTPTPWGSIEPKAVDALVLPGGHAQGMRQYLGSAQLQGLVAAIWERDVPVAAICHGVLVLARARLPSTSQSALRDVHTTCLPGYMERTAYWSTAWKRGRYYRTYPAYVETEVRGALHDPKRQFERGPVSLFSHGKRHDDSAAFAVEDGRYVSARWPGDAYLFAKKLLERL
jgi:putative intracellular protease/amidase